MTALFAILEYVSTYIDVSFPESGSIALTIVALLLPLSSLWAGMAIHEEASRLDISHLSGHNMQNSNSQRSNPSNGSRSNNKTAVSSVTECKCGISGEYGEYSSTTIKNKVECGTPPDRRDSTEMDLEAMGVRVDKSYSLQSGKEGRVF
jgi:pheromone alpha factor receptor